MAKNKLLSMRQDTKSSALTVRNFKKFMKTIEKRMTEQSIRPILYSAGGFMSQVATKQMEKMYGKD